MSVRFVAGMSAAALLVAGVVAGTVDVRAAAPASRVEIHEFAFAPAALSVPVGTTVTVEGHPSRKEGARSIAAGKITKADGSVVWFGGGGGIAAG